MTLPLAEIPRLEIVSYHTVSGISQSEYTVKKSRFIARVVPVESREQAMAAVEQAKIDYPDARHHCWAYLLGSPVDARSAGMSDDGEPAGTAAKPILNVIQHGEIGDVLVVVIRYFGGIKLGAGGLVRAYSSATAQALEEAPSLLKLQRSLYRVTGSYETEQKLRHWLSTVNGEMKLVEYGEPLVFSLLLPQPVEPGLRAFCAANKLQRLEQE